MAKTKTTAAAAKLSGPAIRQSPEAPSHGE